MRPDAKLRRSHCRRRSAEVFQRRQLRRDELHNIKEDTEPPAKQQGSFPSGGGQAALTTPLEGIEDFTLVLCNLDGYNLRKRGELHAHLSLLNFPMFVAVNETKLDKSTENFSLENYILVSRRDGREGQRATKKRHGGGVALFVRTDCAATVTLPEHSETHERSWHLVHTVQGPLLLCVRPLE